MILPKAQYLFEKITHVNNRLKQLKLQGEKSNSKTLRNLRYKRNIFIKELVEELTVEITYSSALLEKEK